MLKLSLALITVLLFASTIISDTQAQQTPKSTPPSSEQTRLEEFKNSHSSFFHVYFAERTDMRAGYLFEKSGQDSTSPAEFDLHNLFADFSFLSPLNENSFFSLGGAIESRRYLFQSLNTPTGSIGSENLYKFAITPGYGLFINESILFWAQASIGHYSDLDRGLLNRDDYQLLGSAQLIFRINPGAQVILGASYTNTYLDQQFLPFVGLRLLSETGKIHISVDFPFHARMGYYITPHIETFGQVVVSGDRYRATIDGDEIDVGVHDQRAGLGFRFWLGTYISWTFEGGRTLSSDFKFYKRDGSAFTQGDIDPHWYGRSYLGLAF